MGTSFDPRFLWLVVHDLRNPLNVIKLTLRMIQDTMPECDPELQSDLTIVNDHVLQLERMLSRLSDYSRLSESGARLEPAPFDPRRFVAEVVELHNAQAKPGVTPVVVEAGADCPPRVELDPQRAKVALLCALENAAGGADGAPIRVALGGGPDRLEVGVTVDRPPRETVKPTPLRPDSYERLAATPNERVSLESALAARVSEMFGGSARLDVRPGLDTTLVLDWPARPPA